MIDVGPLIRNALEAFKALQEVGYKLEYCADKTCRICRRNAEIEAKADKAIVDLEKIVGPVR